MFEKLKHRWGVNSLNLALIIITFAVGGSLCGYAGRKLLSLTHIDKGALWIVLYIILITLLWPLAVLIISIPMGQFSFFKRYIVNVFKRVGGKQTQHHIKPLNIAIFASGAGSNAAKIIAASLLDSSYKVALIVCNKPGAGVLDIAAKAGIPYLLIEKEQFFKGDAYLSVFQKNNIDFIVLAGFLWKIPGGLIKAYPKKIINIHPALLPKYGGKGMFGHYVHEAVISNKEKESGITIHYVDELYDHGAIIFQATCAITEDDTAATLAQKIHVLEHTHYPQIIADVLQQ